MPTLIRYELKKIFQNKLFLWAFLLLFIGIFYFSAYSLNQYREGVIGEYTLSELNGVKIPEMFVASWNIDEYRAKLEAFEADDSNYVDKGLVSGGPIYFGKYESNYMNQTPPVLVIKREYITEYFKVYMPVKQYDIIKNAIEDNRAKARESLTPIEKLRLDHLIDIEEKALKDGFTVGYDYGWENILRTLSLDTGFILAAVLIFGLCNVFTGEYSGKTDSLLLTSKRGKGTLTAAKLTVSIIYSMICWAIYIFMTVSINFAYLGTEGANVGIYQSNIERFFSAVFYILLGCVLIALMTLAVSACFSKPTSSVGVSLFLGIGPLIYAEYGDERFLKIMPVNMISGNYIRHGELIYFSEKIIDIRCFFIPVAMITVLICVPIMFAGYCKRQVKS
ncbi:MAG: ABC-2 family transporter protein [Firmicutes bacterium ADurb.Bin300]|nr:MAG: ABC-2 family transporter protein [Firmicutes bacterium ADurb.Bin300]